MTRFYTASSGAVASAAVASAAVASAAVASAAAFGVVVPINREGQPAAAIGDLQGGSGMNALAAGSIFGP